MEKIALAFLTFLVLFSASGLALAEFDLVIVRSDVSTDYIIGSAYASSAGVPILLTDPDELSEEEKRQLSSYKSEESSVLILGGKEAISENIENEVEELGFSVTRIWDWDRYGTASRAALDLWGTSNDAILVDGEDSTNYLRAQRLAIEKSYPILFTKTNDMPETTSIALQRMGVQRVYTYKNVDTGGYQNIELESGDVVLVEIEKEKQVVPFILVGIVFILIALVAYLWYKKSNIPDSILTDEEKEIIKHIKKGARQNELPALTGFSKPKISRLLQDMEERDIVEREKEKKTYKIDLKVEIR